jgi:hypothetical protein
VHVALLVFLFVKNPNGQFVHAEAASFEYVFTAQSLQDVCFKNS